MICFGGGETRKLYSETYNTVLCAYMRCMSRRRVDAIASVAIGGVVLLSVAVDIKKKERGLLGKRRATARRDREESKRVAKDSYQTQNITSWDVCWWE